jgi:hypothetical protein
MNLKVFFDDVINEIYIVDAFQLKYGKLRGRCLTSHIMFIYVIDYFV